ncbi:hypothetical protein Tco_0751215 [Tanacetum coccineum]|uniref:Uncharacterized protein n=1 Tax=Tanacetum coccineum TaxID=301880 RepID=A0ABQ4Z3F3_9ASTR
MPSTPGGIESSCSRNSLISSIRKSLPPKGVKDGERESIISKMSITNPSTRVNRFNDIVEKVLSITNFEGHGIGHRA